MAVNRVRNDGPQIHKSIIVELRNNIRSATVFAKLAVTSTGCNIKLCKSGFTLTKNDLSVKVSIPEITIVVESLRCIDYIDHSLVFQFDYEGPLTSRKVEVLTTDDEPMFEDCFNWEDLDLETEYDLHCVNCDNILGTQKFERVLPLPTGFFNPGDWYCHAPSKNNDKHDEIMHCVPNQPDILYTEVFFYIRQDIIKKKVIGKKVARCSQCFNWIGTFLQGLTVKLWCHSVKFSFVQVSTVSNTCNLILLKHLNDTCLNASKFVISCQMSDESVEYILLWVMEKKLKIYDVNKRYDHVSKVLYKYETTVTDMVNLWRKDLHIVHLEFSRPMFEYLLQMFAETKEIIPDKYSVSNGFTISYITYSNYTLLL